MALPKPELEPSVVRAPFVAASMAPPSHAARHAWRVEELDDVPLTGNEGTEADMERALVVEQELLLQEEETSTSYEQETFDSLKLLLAGASAGGVSKSATAPLARLTILYQVRRGRPGRSLPCRLAAHQPGAQPR